MDEATVQSVLIGTSTVGTDSALCAERILNKILKTFNDLLRIIFHASGGQNMFCLKS